MRLIGVAAVGAMLLVSAAAKTDVLVNISKSQQRMSVAVDDTELYRWPASTGRRGFATPSGSFHPVRLERHWYSRQYEMTPMPWSMFFFRGYAVHGTMEAHNLGRAASHGCVRLRPDHAATLFSLMHKQKLAAIMIVVFGSFILGGELIIKEFGLGLAAAIFVDAVIIRTALVPSLMLMLGKVNWWFPPWLDRILPRIHMEPEDTTELTDVAEPVVATVASTKT